MSTQQTIKRVLIEGTTPRIRFQIVDPDGVGFLPETLTMSIYDVDFSVVPATQTIVNGRSAEDILSACDAQGNVEVYLTTADTDVEVPDQKTPATIERRVLFTWTWDTTKVDKLEITLQIAPDRATAAS